MPLISDGKSWQEELEGPDSCEASVDGGETQGTLPAVHRRQRAIQMDGRGGWEEGSSRHGRVLPATSERGATSGRTSSIVKGYTVHEYRLTTPRQLVYGRKCPPRTAGGLGRSAITLEMGDNIGTLPAREDGEPLPRKELHRKRGCSGAMVS